MNHSTSAVRRINPDPSPTSIPLVRIQWHCCWTDLTGASHSSIPFADKPTADALAADLKKCPLVLRAWVLDSTQLLPLGGKAVG